MGIDMTDFNPKQGEMILVGAFIDEEREFIVMDKGKYLCRGKNGEKYYLWTNGRPLPTKPEPIPFTHETWPKRTVHIKRNTWEANVFELVTGRYSEGVTHDGDRTTFNELLYDHRMSLDYCRTWQPCHYSPNPTE